VTTDERAFHYVCRRQEAAQLINAHNRFWVVACGCRKERGDVCRSSRHDICLWFHGHMHENFGSPSEISRAQAMRLLAQAKTEHLVTRPFRNEQDRSITEGICFCCDDCCYYFVKPGEKCDKGAFVEHTDADLCRHCGTCVEVCYFRARELNDDALKVTKDSCYGCGLCVDICPEDAIEMVKAG